MTLLTVPTEEKIINNIVPYTFNLDKLDVDKVEKLDIFFQIIRVDIEEEQEIYNLNH